MDSGLSKSYQFRQNQRVSALIGTLLLLISVSVFLGSFIGPSSSPIESFQKVFFGTDELQKTLVLEIRLPRVILGFLAGAALAISGAALQSLFNNPLADSGLIGISSGAMLGVMVGVLFGATMFPRFSLPLLAFLGSCLLGFLVYRLSLNHKRVEISLMLLSGVAVNAFAGAFSGLLINIADDEQLRTMTFWAMGSLNGANWEMVTTLAVTVSIGSFLLLKMAKELDALGLGEREALSMGVETQKVKRRILVLSAFICGPVISFTGLIGFIGLVVPHILRLFIGPKNGPLLLCSLFLGGVFLILADILSKTIVAPMELPIGIITTIVGTPFFTYLLLKQKRRLS